ncbi:general transcription factor 3C polypeptide 6 [Sitodiplosis mosellana]|uniref:general transcription factor 3C polypeptide 6 n=1 Tax=Sitodiplosis mosellana TaxID=263140 RepID=UPI0024442C23|nr:general transcription factor 3C polypeptide 6 [Sitodiplosis mosellana]
MSSKTTTDKDDDRYETEEFYVYVDLDTKLLDDQLTKSNAKIKFLGIDTENPIMQLNNQLFKGAYEYSMGTHCFFSESKRPGGVEDACFQEMPAKLYDYFAKTDKVLRMQRIFVEEKESETDSELAEGEIENLEHLHVSKTYSEALNQFLKPGEEPPREIQDSPDSEEEEQEEETRMEVDQISEAPSLEPSEESENTKQARIEKTVHEEFERLTDPNYEYS